MYCLLCYYFSLLLIIAIYLLLCSLNKIDLLWILAVFFLFSLQFFCMSS